MDTRKVEISHFQSWTEETTSGLIPPEPSYFGVAVVLMEGKYIGFQKYVSVYIYIYYISHYSHNFYPLVTLSSWRTQGFSESFRSLSC